MKRVFKKKSFTRKKRRRKNDTQNGVFFEKTHGKKRVFIYVVKKRGVLIFKGNSGDNSWRLLQCLECAQLWCDFYENNVFGTKRRIAERTFGTEPSSASKVLCCVCPQCVGNTVTAAWVDTNWNCSVFGAHEDVKCVMYLL